MKNLTIDNWISIGNIVVPIIVSTICGIVQYIITSVRIRRNNTDIKANKIIDYLEHLRNISSEYWGKISMTPEYQQMLETSIKSYFCDIKRNLDYLYKKLKRRKKDIVYSLLTNDYINLHNLITGDSFETSQRQQDKKKCSDIINFIDDFIKKIETSI